jgi:hypothetical protein
MNRLVLNNGGVVDEHVDSTVRVEVFGNDSLPELGIGHVTLRAQIALLHRGLARQLGEPHGAAKAGESVKNTW